MERKDVDPTKNLNEPPSRIIAFHGELKLSRVRKKNEGQQRKQVLQNPLGCARNPHKRSLPESDLIPRDPHPQSSS